MAGKSAPKRSRTASDYIEIALTFLARLAAVAFLLSAGYLLLQVFSGGLRAYPMGFPPALRVQLTHNLQVAGELMLGSSLVFTVCFVLLMWGWEWAGPLFIAGGLIFYVGIPYFGVPYLSGPSLNQTRGYHPGADILLWLRLTSGVFFLGAAIFVTGWAWEKLRETLSAPRKAGGVVRIPFYSSCWQTHYCKEEINQLCEPGRRGFHKSCWRYKSGCFCDESIGDRVFAAARKTMGDDAQKWFGARAPAPAPTLADRLHTTHHRAPGQKIACADCPIYNFHEVQKHRMLAPILLLAVPAWMFYNSDSLHAHYQAAIGAIDRFALHLVMAPGTTTAVRSQIHGALDVPAVEWLVFGVICIAALSLVARALEIWCFELKL